MNKISKICIILGIAMMVFSIGYKIGDAKGYEAGYTEGYRYDCREEIGNLYNQVKATKRAVDFTNKKLKLSLQEKDSLRGIIDSMKYPVEYRAIKTKYHEDTLKFGKIADRRNDSLRKVGHPAAGMVSRQSGIFPPLLCLAYKDNKELVDLPECRKFFETHPGLK